MKTILILLLGTAVSTSDISMLGIHINSPAPYKISLKAVNTEENTIKYKTDNGNHLSITTEDGKVVFMENDWLHEKAGNLPLFTNFKFGETSLKEIREAFGTNGFAYKNRSYLKSETDLTTINCFEIDSPNNEVLVIITKSPIKSITDKNNVAQFLTLDAVILSDKKYLDAIWGKKKIYDPNYKKITL